MTLHTEMCEKSEVTSAEEGHDVDGRHAPQSDETADILKQSKDEMSAGLTAFKKKGLDRKTNHEGVMRHSQGRQGRHLGETSRETEVSQWCGLHPRTWSTRLLSKKGVINFMRHLKSLERVSTIQNTIPDELERYGLFKKWKARVAKHDDQSKEHHHENLESKLKQELELKAGDHDSKHDKTIASLFVFLEDVMMKSAERVEG